MKKGEDFGMKKKSRKTKKTRKLQNFFAALTVFIHALGVLASVAEGAAAAAGTNLTLMLIWSAVIVALSIVVMIVAGFIFRDKI